MSFQASALRMSGMTRPTAMRSQPMASTLSGVTTGTFDGLTCVPEVGVGVAAVITVVAVAVGCAGRCGGRRSDTGGGSDRATREGENALRQNSGQYNSHGELQRLLRQRGRHEIPVAEPHSRHDAAKREGGSEEL